MSCIGAGGVLSTPGSGEGVLRCFFGSGFLGFFDLLFGSDFGAVLLATVLSELPVLGFQEVLGMLLTIFGFPIVTAQLTFDDDLLALSIGVAKELIVSDSGRSDWSARSSFSQGRIGDQVTTDDDAIDVHC